MEGILLGEGAQPDAVLLVNVLLAQREQALPIVVPEPLGTVKGSCSWEQHTELSFGTTIVSLSNMNM